MSLASGNVEHRKGRSLDLLATFFYAPRKQHRQLHGYANQPKRHPEALRNHACLGVPPELFSGCSWTVCDGMTQKRSSGFFWAALGPSWAAFGFPVDFLRPLFG